MDLQHQRLTRPASGALSANGYLQRIEQALADWFLLAGEPPDLALFHDMAAALSTLPSANHWRNHSKLCADGAPVEFCFNVGRWPAYPAFTVDPGPYAAPPAERLRHAFHVARKVLAGRHREMETIDLLAESYQPPPPSFALWLGAEYGAGSPSVKLYASTGRADTKLAQECALTFLQAMDRKPDPACREILILLRELGYFRQLALTLSASAQVRTKLYFRLARVDLALLARLSELGDLPLSPFSSYLCHILGESDGWRDPEAGVGLAVDESGKCTAIALYHYQRFYFQDDDRLRHRILRAGPQMGWNVDTFRAASRLLPAQTSSRQFSLGGFGVSLHGCGLRLYASTGQLSSSKLRSSVPHFYN